ncbi:MAG: IS3 family transposase [Truepera sp.]|nr:IS3 family transposase [Truepera sp.]
MSERRACRVMRQPRSPQRYQPRVADDEAVLVKRLYELASRHPRYGYRRVTSKLRREGWRVNHKRVARLLRQEGLRVPRRTRKRERLGSSENSCSRRAPTAVNEVWTIDFVMDQTRDGRRLKILPILDEFSRYCHSIVVARSLTGNDVMVELERLMTVHGAQSDSSGPGFIRCDNGPEFIANAVQELLADANVETLFIEPGSPWENGYAESFMSRFRDPKSPLVELLNLELFATRREADPKNPSLVLIERYRREYNLERPHTRRVRSRSLGYLTPADPENPSLFVEQRRVTLAAGTPSP